jgi:MFS transporter, FHS family, glucose/mannose:H+ symporter
MKRFLIAIHAVFVLVGVANTILGPLLPVLAQRWVISDRQLGALFLAEFCGGFTGAITSTQLARRFSAHWITRIGLLLIAAGFVGLTTFSRLGATMCIGLVGIGIGFANPSITVMVSDAVPEHRAAIFNLLNFAWGVGAITAPNLVLAAMGHSAFSVSQMLRGFALVVAIASILMPKISASPRAEPPSHQNLPAGTLPLIVVCGVLIFLYVGVETGIAGWLPTFALRIHHFTDERMALLQDTFWTTFLLGRLCAPAFLRVLSERVLLTISLLLAMIGSVGLLALESSAMLFFAVAIIGIGCAAVFPTAIAILSQQLAAHTGSKLGFIFAAAGLGAAAVPFCVGWLSSATHDLRSGMWLLVAAEIALLGAHVVMSRLTARLRTGAA